jgi:mevalonate kinase
MGKDSVIATAPGKIILFGEHAVVYGQPAIAVPVHQVQAAATVAPGLPGSGLILSAVDLGRVTPLAEAAADDPLAAMARLTLAYLDASPPDATLTVRSTIPVASGLGSGAAVSTVIVRALAAYLGRELEPTLVSRLVYEVEKLHHGTPSGIDNTVVAYGMPVYFRRGQRPETFQVGAPLHLVIGDTGVASPTRIAVGDVRRGWERDTQRYERLFAQVGALVRQARELIEGDALSTRYARDALQSLTESSALSLSKSGADVAGLGELMDRNHELLCQMDVSSPELERLVAAARAAGALGAKLSGAGRGGNMIALVKPGDEARVAGALRQAGAVRVINTAVRM